MEMQNFTPGAPGKGMLTVCGILYIVFGGMSLLVGMLALFGAAVMAELGEFAAMDMVGATAGFLAIISILVLIQSGFSIFVGIVAIKNAAVLAKATFVRTVVIIHLVMLILTVALDFSLWALAGLVVPIIALIGAQKNVQANEYNRE